ncbi:MAG: lipocalin family protein [Deltaproteobacteria bacterium]|nr:lipocalin family protein [Deltaproteobacteria bacterium]
MTARLVVLTLAVAATLVPGCGRSTWPVSDLPVVESVDLRRYVGRWYEIASIPQWFQAGCSASTATYALRADGDVDVLNSCIVDGELDTARGRAWVVDPGTNARLKVEFAWPFAGDYWIVELGRDYDYVVVGHPERSALWILARRPRMDDRLYRGILERLAAVGYDVSAIVRTERRPD